MVVYGLLLVGLIFASEAPLLAYLDPGSGSMLVQLMLGGVAALGVVFKLAWHRLASWRPGHSMRQR